MYSNPILYSPDGTAGWRAWDHTYIHAKPYHCCCLLCAGVVAWWLAYNGRHERHCCCMWRTAPRSGITTLVPAQHFSRDTWRTDYCLLPLPQPLLPAWRGGHYGSPVVGQALFTSPIPPTTTPTLYLPGSGGHGIPSDVVFLLWLGWCMQRVHAAAYLPQPRHSLFPIPSSAGFRFCPAQAFAGFAPPFMPSNLPSILSPLTNLVAGSCLCCICLPTHLPRLSGGLPPSPFRRT